MSILALFLALLLDQFRPLRAQHGIYAALRGATLGLQRHLDAGAMPQAWLLWALVTLVPALLSWWIWLLLDMVLGSFFALLWSVAVLYVTLDFRAFGLHFTEVRNAVNTGDEAGARAALAQWFAVSAGGVSLPAAALSASGTLVAGVTRLSLEHMHRFVFGVFAAYLMLAFVGLGPMGAVLFRSADYAHRRWWAYPHRDALHLRASPALARAARQGWQVVNGVPARLSASMYAAVGRYDEAIAAWRTTAAARPGDGDALVCATGAAAMGMGVREAALVLLWPSAAAGRDDGFAPSDPSHVLHRLASMIWRTLVLWALIWLVVGLIGAVR